MPMRRRLLVLGVGYAGEHILAARGRESSLGLVRREVRRAELEARGLDAERTDELASRVLALADETTHVVVTFPPDGATDQHVADALSKARLGAVTYLSSTVVYGERRGVVDDETPVTEAPSPAAALRLSAEEAWRSLGATILRCPAIYGPERGLHVRVLAGLHKVAGDGSGATSRIHVEDLAALALAAPRAPRRTFVVGDAEPARQRDVVDWIVETYGVSQPPSVPAAMVHETLRGDRRVDGRGALEALGVTLRYPSFRDGMARR